MPGALSLLKNGLQHVCGRSTVQDVVLEMGKCLFERLDALPLGAAILHGKELPAQIVEPQHVGVGVVLSPVISEITQEWTWCQLKQKQNTNLKLFH